MRTITIALLILIVFTIEAILVILTVTVYALVITMVNDRFITSELIKKL